MAVVSVVVPFLAEVWPGEARALGAACRETAMITLALAGRNTHSDLGKCLSQGETRRSLIHPSNSSTVARPRALVNVSKVLIDG